MRRGFTLIEMLIASAILASLMAALAIMSDAVYRGSEHCEGYGAAAQHARVVTDRIARCVVDATANDVFPGILVLSEIIDSESFPDTLIVWSPVGQAIDPAGMPRVGELVIYTPQDAAPNQLLEITLRGDNSATPALNALDAWRQLVEEIQKRNDARQVVLTDLLRVAQVNANRQSRRGAVRFVPRLSPSQAQWEDFCEGDLSWSQLTWAQGIRGSESGLRQAWVRYELQLTPGDEFHVNDPETMPALPFFGSAALYYTLTP